jgi:hypothetical protein
MAGFEVIVRPVILPNIRPPPPRVLLPEADPSQGIVVLGGSGGGLIDLSQSGSASFSVSKGKETKRKFDVERIYHKDDEDDGGEVDKDQFMDVERLKSLSSRDGNGIESSMSYADPPERDNVEILKRNQERISKP